MKSFLDSREKLMLEYFLSSRREKHYLCLKYAGSAGFKKG